MHFELIVGSLLLDFRMPLLFFLGGGRRETFRHQFVPFWKYVSIIFVKNNVLPAWELSFQPDLSSHAGETAVFDFKKQGVQFLVSFFHFLICFVASF